MAAAGAGVQEVAGPAMDMHAALQVIVGGGGAPAAGEQAELAGLEQAARNNAKRQRELQKTIKNERRKKTTAPMKMPKLNNVEIEDSTARSGSMAR